jgi:hypothetical protein
MSLNLVQSFAAGNFPTGALLAAALLAMAKPARDAVAVDPMVALRDE